MAIVDIGAETYTVYAELDTADAYLTAAAHGATWRAETDDDVKRRAIVTATRLIDRQTWKDDYDTVAKRQAVQAFIDATIELANAIVDGSEVQDNATTANRQRRIKAGSVEIENFRGAEGPVTRFPRIVHELIGGFLKGADFNLGPTSSGTSRDSVFPFDHGFSSGI